MSDEQIKYMRDRFLNWTLPLDLNPDGGITYKRSESAIKYNHPGPTGTNFLDAVQAEAMVRHMIDGMPADEQLREARAALDAMTRERDALKYEPDGQLRANLSNDALLEILETSGACMRERDRLRDALQNLAFYTARISPPPYGHSCRWCEVCVQRAKDDARAALAPSETAKEPKK